VEVDRLGLAIAEVLDQIVYFLQPLHWEEEAEDLAIVDQQQVAAAEVAVSDIIVQGYLLWEQLGKEITVGKVVDREEILLIAAAVAAAVAAMEV
jgi:hypothetical protein